MPKITVTYEGGITKTLEVSKEVAARAAVEIMFGAVDKDMEPKLSPEENEQLKELSRAIASTGLERPTRMSPERV